jgi:phosphoribosyl 1,2-cyclic phosphodiesterase
VLIESNHSPELLMANRSYSYPLKQRILSMRGHLSNEDCAAAVTALARNGVKHFILAHLSKENNYPELAYSVCRAALARAGLTNDVGLEVACADRLGGLMEIV